MDSIIMTPDNLNKYSKQQLVDMLLEREAVSKSITEHLK